MAHFIKLALTVYDDDGIPNLGAADDHWVNLDQIESVNELSTDTLFRTHRTDPGYFPHLTLTMSSGRVLVVPIGRYGTSEDWAGTHSNDSSRSSPANPTIHPHQKAAPAR